MDMEFSGAEAGWDTMWGRGAMRAVVLRSGRGVLAQDECGRGSFISLFLGGGAGGVSGHAIHLNVRALAHLQKYSRVSLCRTIIN